MSFQSCVESIIYKICFAVSSWKSHASTISNISSSVATPPPMVNQPKASTPQQNNTFDWISPISSAQSSPSSSLRTNVDREVDFAMNKSNCILPNSGLTPSPSVLLPDIFVTTVSNDTDLCDEVLSFLMEEDVTRPLSPTESTPPTQHSSPYRLTELTNLTPVVETISTPDPFILPPRPEVQEYVNSLRNDNNTIQSTNPLSQTCKRSCEIECITLDESPPKRTNHKRLTPNDMPVWGNIELPPKKTAKIKKLQTRRIPRVKKSCATVEVTCSNESVAASVTPTPEEDKKSRKKPLVTEPQVSQVALNMDANGTPVFVIQPAIPSPAPKPSSTKKPSATRSGRPTKTAAAPVPDPIKKPVVKKRSNKEDPFCIEKLVEKFIRAANNRKLPDPKAP